MPSQRILVVEDSPAIAEGLRVGLVGAGYEVALAGTVAAARAAAGGPAFDLYLVDVTLPDGSGLDLCRELRARFPAIPILILTALTDESSAVEGLGAGASDYLRKPVGKRELVARLRNWLGEAPAAPARKLRFEGLELDLGAREAVCSGVRIALSRSEFEILSLLVRRRGDVVTRDEMLNLIDTEGEVTDRAVDSHLSRIRSKFRKAGISAVQISPAYGMGYRLVWSP